MFTATGLLNTSVDDCIVSLPHVKDLALLRELLEGAERLGHKTRAHFVKRRIKQIEDGNP